MKPLSDRRLCDVPLRARALPAQSNLGGRYRKGAKPPSELARAMRILYQLTSPMEKTALGPDEVKRRREFLRARAAPGVDVEVLEPGGRASVDRVRVRGRAGRPGADSRLVVRAQDGEASPPRSSAASPIPASRRSASWWTIPVSAPARAPCTWPRSSAPASASSRRSAVATGAWRRGSGASRLADKFASVRGIDMSGPRSWRATARRCSSAAEVARRRARRRRRCARARLHVAWASWVSPTTSRSASTSPS